MSSEGRGTMKFEGHYDVDEDIEGFFPLIKARLLGAVTDWLRRGWLTAADLQGVISTPAAASVKKVRKKKATE